VVERRRGFRRREHAIYRGHRPAHGEQRDDRPGKRLHRRCLLLYRAGAQHRAAHAGPLGHQTTKRDGCLFASAGADDNDPSFQREDVEIEIEIRRPDKLEHYIRAAQRGDALGGGVTGDNDRTFGGERPGRIGRPDEGDDPGAGREPQPDACGADTASCAVMYASGTAAATSSARLSGIAATCRS